MSAHNLCFEAKNRKNRYTSAYPSFTIKGVYISQLCFPDEYLLFFCPHLTFFIIYLILSCFSTKLDCTQMAYVETGRKSIMKDFA